MPAVSSSFHTDQEQSIETAFRILLIRMKTRNLSSS